MYHSGGSRGFHDYAIFEGWRTYLWNLRRANVPEGCHPIGLTEASLKETEHNYLIIAFCNVIHGKNYPDSTTTRRTYGYFLPALFILENERFIQHVCQNSDNLSLYYNGSDKAKLRLRTPHSFFIDIAGKTYHQLKEDVINFNELLRNFTWSTESRCRLMDKLEQRTYSLTENTTWQESVEIIKKIPLTGQMPMSPPKFSMDSSDAHLAIRSHRPASASPPPAPTCSGCDKSFISGESFYQASSCKHDDKKEDYCEKCFQDQATFAKLRQPDESPKSLFHFYCSECKQPIKKYIKKIWHHLTTGWSASSY